MTSRVLTIMFTDIKGFTERTSAASREALVGLLKKHETLLVPIIKKFGGTVIKTIGDAFLVTFESPTNAVLCGVMIQQNLREYNAGRPEAEQIFIRVSINMGEIELRDGDVFGEAVNIAARVEGITDASEIFFTESVYLAMNKAEVPSSEVDSFRLKGIPEAIRVYRVIQDTNSDSFQKIIERLRGDNFSDTFLPSTGSAFGAGAEKKTSRLVLGAIALAATGAVAYGALFMRTPARDLAACLDCLKSGDQARALLLSEEMMAKYPSDKNSMEAVRAVAIHQIGAPKAKKEFEKAYKAIEDSRARYPWLDLAANKKALLLAEADIYGPEENYRALEAIYRDLFETSPKDADAMWSVIKHCGANFKGGPTSRAIEAAIELSKAQVSDASSEVLFKTLLAGLKNNEFRSETAAGIRAALKDKYPKAGDEIKKMFASDNISEKANAFVFLRENSRLSEAEEFNYHYNALVNYDSSGSDHIREAVNYFDSAVKGGNIEKLKKSVGFDKKISNVAILSTCDSLAGNAAMTLISAFKTETLAGAVSWANTKDDYWLRWNGYFILRQLGKLDSIDLWSYHARTLECFDPAFIPDIFLDAVEYFSGPAGNAKQAEAKAALSKCVDYVNEYIKKYEDKAGSEYVERARKNIKTLKAAIEKLEK